MAMSLLEMTEAYLDGARVLRQAVAGMTRDQALSRPVAGKWSTLEVVSHLADFEALGALRIKWTLAEDQPTLFDGDETRFAAALAYQERDLEDEVTLIENTRRQVVRILRASPPGVLARGSVYRIGDKTENRTVEQFLAKAIGHLTHHLPFIHDKRRALGLA
jgi:hypothetical protein